MMKEKNYSLVALSCLLAVLQAIYRNAHEHFDILRLFWDSYKDPDYPDHMLESGGSALEKQIRWAVWKLLQKKFITRSSRDYYHISPKGLEWLKALPYYLDNGLEPKLDDEGLISGKLLYELHKHDPSGIIGSRMCAADVRSALGTSDPSDGWLNESNLLKQLDLRY